MSLQNVDFENVYTYKHSGVIFLFIVSGTGLYTLRHLNDWLGPFMLLSYSLVAFGYFCSLSTIQKNPPEMVEAGIIWLGWLIYGMLFTDVRLVVASHIGYIRECAILFTVLLNYWKTNSCLIKPLFFLVGMSLFFPNSDMIANRMENNLLFLKITLFFFLFFLAEVTSLSLDYGKNYSDLYGTHNSYPPAKGFGEMEIKIIRSSWVFLVSKYALLISIFQFGFFCWLIYKKYYFDKDISKTILPIIVIPNKENFDIENNNSPILNTRQRTSINKIKDHKLTDLERLNSDSDPNPNPNPNPKLKSKSKSNQKQKQKKNQKITISSDELRQVFLQ